MPGSGAVVFVASDALVLALATIDGESAVAARWARTYAERFDASAALRALVDAARASKDTGKRVFLVELF
jgi:hypothetical protein